MSLVDMAAVAVVAGLLYATTKASAKSKLSTPPASKRVEEVYEGGEFENYKEPSKAAQTIDVPKARAQAVSMKIASF